MHVVGISVVAADDQRELCATPNQQTPWYRDDTDERPGECEMQWSVQTDSVFREDWFNQVQICYK